MSENEDAGTSQDAGTSPNEDAGMPDSGLSADAGTTSVPLCLMICESPSDCALPPTDGAYQASNFACVSGICKYLGCASDAECAATFRTDKYVCRQLAGALFPSCISSCQTSADCASPPTDGAFSADNYSCADGVCQYAGCHDDSECAVSLQSSQYACRQVAGLPYKSCTPLCQTSADCASPPTDGAFNASNYDCVSGLCHYRGCQSDAECQTSFRSTSYTCGSP